MRSYAADFRHIAEAATERKTICRLCNKIVDEVFSLEHLEMDAMVTKFKCHGEIDHQGAIIRSYRDMRMTEIEHMIWSWPVIAFDRYTMIPLPPTHGFVEENDEICAAGTAGLNWLHALEMDPHAA